MTVTTSQLDELERKARAAETPGPWQWDSAGDALESATKPHGARVLGAALCGYENSYIYGNESDKAHIAANSPDVTLALIARIRELEAAERADLPLWATLAIRALHDMVDQTNPNDPIGVALTKAGLERRP